VQPVIFTGGPIQNAKERNFLLSQRAEEANLQYLLTESNKRRKKTVNQNNSRTKRALLDTTISTNSTSTNECTGSTVTNNDAISNNNNRKKRKQAVYSTSSSSSDVEEEEEDEDEEEKKTATDSDNESVHELSDYMYLIDTMHYDPEEKCIYKSTRVLEEGEYIVVYRKRQLKNGQWSARDSPQSIFAKDIVEMTNLYSSMNNKK
jgi:hypothetical protein